MKVAVIGSRNLTVMDLEKYLPQGITELYQAVQEELILAQKLTQ